MASRKKTSLERFFSLKQHMRRHGYKKLTKDFPDLKSLKKQKISGNTREYTLGSKASLSEHLEDLRKEFIGRSELEFYHAQLNVFLRRGIDVKTTFRHLKLLWELESIYLLENLNTRWLISAADSFIDHDCENSTKAFAFAAVCLVNTCKLYETERFLAQTREKYYTENSIKEIKNKRVPLFDGTSAFKLGTCDTLRNMKWRLDSMKQNSPCFLILKEIFNRLNSKETVYNRFAKYHTNKNTTWF